MKTKIYVAGKTIAEILRTVPPPAGMTYEINPLTHDALPDSSSIIILKHLPATFTSAKYILCTKSPETLKPETLSRLYDLWPEPLTPSLLRFHFTKLLDRVNSESLNTHRIIEMAQQDYLTGLATRWYLNEHLTQNSDAECITCIYFDLDNFKAVNDTYGHQAGDRALAATAEMMQQNFSDGFCARMGGDEFMIVLLGHCEISDVETRVDSFMNKLRAYYSAASTMKALSVSAGISQKLKGDDKTIDRLIHESDIALYAAKNSGRSCCKTYTKMIENESSQPRSIYLVDYENVHSGGLDGIHKLGSDSRVCIFYSRNASHLAHGLNMNIRESQAQITYHHAEAGEKNALDFQLSSYLGELISENIGKDCRYYIVSRDVGFSGLVPFWRERGAEISVIPDILGHSTAEQNELARRVEILTGDKINSQAIAEIIRRCETKIEVNTAIQRLYRSNKACGIYRMIKPLIDDKPGQHKR